MGPWDYPMLRQNRRTTFNSYFAIIFLFIFLYYKVLSLDQCWRSRTHFSGSEPFLEGSVTYISPLLSLSKSLFSLSLFLVFSLFSYNFFKTHFNLPMILWIKLVKRRMLFLSSDLWSPGAGFFLNGIYKLLR